MLTAHITFDCVLGAAKCNFSGCEQGLIGLAATQATKPALFEPAGVLFFIEGKVESNVEEADCTLQELNERNCEQKRNKEGSVKDIAKISFMLWIITHGKLPLLF